MVRSSTSTDFLAVFLRVLISSRRRVISSSSLVKSMSMGVMISWERARMSRSMVTRSFQRMLRFLSWSSISGSPERGGRQPYSNTRQRDWGSWMDGCVNCIMRYFLSFYDNLFNYV